jgi:hypothetical protein
MPESPLVDILFSQHSPDSSTGRFDIFNNDIWGTGASVEDVRLMTKVLRGRVGNDNVKLVV